MKTLKKPGDDQVGLKKLPKNVRNKMGYMEDGGAVKEYKKGGKVRKDACYHKVKARYKVWPSAYASGALVRCRKVGASNWGNKSKK